MVWAAAIPLIASAVTAGANYLGQANANDANVGMANATNSANAAQNLAARENNMDMFNASGRRADQQFDATWNRTLHIDAINKQYATEMSNTAYQRAMGDMRQAGLNPMLAYQQGGANATPVSASAPGGGSSPTGSVSPGNAMVAPRVANELSGAVGSAMQAANVVMQLRQADATIKQTEAQTRLTGAQEALSNIDAVYRASQNMTERERAPLTSALAQESRARIPLIGADTDRARAQAAQSGALTDQQREETRDYRNWGPPGTARNAAASAERIGTRAGTASAEAISNLPRPTLPSIGGIRERITTTDGDRSTPLRALSERILDLLR